MERNLALEYRVRKQREDQVEEIARELEQTQDCKRGEHLYETGRTTCRLCGEDL